MASSVKRRLRLRHLTAAVSIVALLVGFGQVWTTITLTTGQQVSLTGNDQATLAVSLLLVAAAAHALSLLVYRAAHLIAVIVQLVATAGALWAIIHGLLAPVSQASAEITALTGLSGQQTLLDLVATTDVAVFPVVSSLLGGVGMLIAGIIGWGVGRRRPEAAPRFERPGQSGQQHPWDDLTDGVDPTDR